MIKGQGYFQNLFIINCSVGKRYSSLIYGLMWLLMLFKIPIMIIISNSSIFNESKSFTNLNFKVQIIRCRYNPYSMLAKLELPIFTKFPMKLNV